MDIQLRNIGPVDSFDIELERGQAKVIAAPNAWGKTTIARTIIAMLARADDPLGLSPTEAKLHRRRDIGKDEEAYCTVDSDDGWSLTWRPREKVIATGGAPKLPAELTDIPALLRTRGKKAATAWRGILGGEVTLELLKERIEAALADEPEGGRIAKEVLDAYTEESPETFWSTMHTIAEQRMRDSKRNWSRVVATCGEHEGWGSNKASNWRPRNHWTAACEGLTLTQAQAQDDKVNAALEDARRESYRSEQEIAERNEAIEKLPEHKKDWVDAVAAASKLRKVVVNGMHEAKYDRLMEEAGDSEVTEQDVNEAQDAWAEALIRQNEAEAGGALWNAWDARSEQHSSWKRKLAEFADAKVRLTKERDAYLAEHSGEFEQGRLACPKCSAELRVEKGALVEASHSDTFERILTDLSKAKTMLLHLAENEPPEPGNEPPKAGSDNLIEIIGAARTAEGRYEDLRRKSDESSSALDRLRGVETYTEDQVAESNQATEYAGACEAKVNELERIIQRIGKDAKAGVQKLPELQDEARKAGQILQAVSATESAREHHKLALLWARVTKLLAPDGLRAEVFGEKIDGLNTTMAAIARKAEWVASPILSEKLVCTYQNWDIRLMSEARQWCVASAMMLAVCALNECPLVALDRADVLDGNTRAETLGAIYALAKAANIGCLIMMTAIGDEELSVYRMEQLENVEVHNER